MTKPNDLQETVRLEVMSEALSRRSQVTVLSQTYQKLWVRPK